MRYVRNQSGKVWHRFDGWADKNECHAAVRVGKAWFKCNAYHKGVRTVYELVTEEHLPKGAKLCKKCSPEKRK